MDEQNCSFSFTWEMKHSQSKLPFLKMLLKIGCISASIELLLIVTTESCLTSESMVVYLWISSDRKKERKKEYRKKEREKERKKEREKMNKTMLRIIAWKCCVLKKYIYNSANKNVINNIDEKYSKKLNDYKKNFIIMYIEI